MLGVDKNARNGDQISSAAADNEVALGTILGRAIKFHEVPGMVERLVDVPERPRWRGERFIDTVGRIGIAPFREGRRLSRRQGAGSMSELIRIANKRVAIENDGWLRVHRTRRRCGPRAMSSCRWPTGLRAAMR